MRDWVAEDVTGKGAIARLMVRMVIPAFLILLPFWFIPASFVVHLSMTVPILIPFIYFSHSQNKVWRRNVLRKHGI
jgi:archaellum biogenesis protein FlaJ (TadC family)